MIDILLTPLITVKFIFFIRKFVWIWNYYYKSLIFLCRYSLSFEPGGNWRLRLVAARKSDEGIYECQVSTHPPMKKLVSLKVVGQSEYIYIVVNNNY